MLFEHCQKNNISLTDNIDMRLFRMSKNNSELWNFFPELLNLFLFYSSHILCGISASRQRNI